MNDDSKLQLKKQVKNNILWLNPLSCTHISVFGFYWLSENNCYNRLPNADVKELNQVSPKVVQLAANTSGGQLHFKTNSKRLTLKAKVQATEVLSGMTPVAQMGFDCYVGKDFEDVKFYDSTKFVPLQNEYEYTFFNGNSDEVYVIINFPLYANVEEVFIGIDPDASICSCLPFKEEERIIVYGTSITQGGCASRPGLSYTNILSRKMKREWMNFGFSGNAFGEPKLIEIISKVVPAKVFIIDYEANAGTSGKLEETLEDIIKIVRKNIPDVHIVVLSRIPYLFDVLNPTLGLRRNEIRVFQKTMVEKMKENGDQKIHFIDGSKFFGKNFHEFTVDSVHPNDLGFLKIVESLEPKLNQILNK